MESSSSEPGLALMESSEPGRASASVFLAFALLAGFAFFIPFFFRAGAPRFAFLDFFAIFNLPNRITKLCNTGQAVAAYLNTRWMLRSSCVSRSSKGCHNEALEISINYCRANSVSHLRRGAAISTAIFETEIIR